MSKTFHHVRLFIRAETLVLELKLLSLLKRSGFLAFAAVIALVWLGMLNYAAYRGLEPYWGPALAALAVAAADFVLAAIIGMLGRSSRPSADLKAAQNVRDAAVEALEGEIQPMQERLRWLTGSVISSAALPILTAVIRAMRRSKAD
jgi:hypothetical protein